MDLMTLDLRQVMLTDTLASLKERGAALYAKKNKKREVRLKELAREEERLRKALSPTAAACRVFPGDHLLPSNDRSLLLSSPRSPPSSHALEKLRRSLAVGEIKTKIRAPGSPSSKIQKSSIESVVKDPLVNDKEKEKVVKHQLVSAKEMEKKNFHQSTDDLRFMLAYIENKFLSKRDTDDEEEVAADEICHYLEKEDLSSIIVIEFTIIGWSSENPKFPATNLQPVPPSPEERAKLCSQHMQMIRLRTAVPAKFRRSAMQMYRAAHGERDDKVVDTGKRRAAVVVSHQTEKVMKTEPADLEPEPVAVDRWMSSLSDGSSQWLLFDLNSPHTIATINLTVISDMTPRSCVFQYSTGNAQGPWEHGFEFETKKGPSINNIVANYNKYAKLFRALLIQQFGSVKRAWHKVLDVARDGRVSYAEFHKVATILGKKGNFEWKEDLQRLFQELDSDNNGELALHDLESTTPILPKSQYWRLMMLRNWDSTIGYIIMRPFNIHVYNDNKSKDLLGGDSRPMVQKREVVDMSFGYKSTDEICQIKEIANAWGVPLLYVNSIADAFRKYDTDNTGMLEYGEFRSLLLTLMKVPDPELLPESRSIALWSYVEKEHADFVDLDEFIKWYMNMFQMVCETTYEDEPKKRGSDEGYVSDGSPATMVYQLLGTKRFVPIIRELHALNSKNRLGIRKNRLPEIDT